MHKYFRAGNANIICQQLNKNKMELVSCDLKSGTFSAVARKSEKEQELRSMEGPGPSVTEKMNQLEREPEHIVVQGNRVIVFYRHDDKKDKEMKEKLAKEEKAKQAKQKKEEEAAKQAEIQKQIEELQKELRSDSKNQESKQSKKSK